MMNYSKLFGMSRGFAYITFLVISLQISCKAATISENDQQILKSFWKYANEHKLTELPLNERIPVIARYFLKTPYKSNTLNVTLKELPVINLQELDCVTLVENVLALTLLNEYNEQASEAFVENIVKLRYRNGEIVDYTSRLHYSSDWLYEMQKQNILTDLTLFAGGVEHPQQIDFMSKNYTRYPQLQNDNQLLDEMKKIEANINQRTHYYIPKAKINAAYGKIKNGDIILITTNIKGLDTSHLGFAWKKNGQTYLLHASSNAKKVMITEVPLQQYMKDINSQTGIMIARISKTIP